MYCSLGNFRAAQQHEIMYMKRRGDGRIASSPVKVCSQRREYFQLTLPSRHSSRHNELDAVYVPRSLYVLYYSKVALEYLSPSSRVAFR